MWFLQAIAVGFAFTLGMEIALGLSYALKYIKREIKRIEKK